MRRERDAVMAPSLLFRHLADRRDQVTQVVGLQDRGLATLLEEAARLVARAVAGDEHEAPGELGALVGELLPQRAAAEPGHLKIGDDRVEPLARGPEPLHRFEP